MISGPLSAAPTDEEEDETLLVVKVIRATAWGEETVPESAGFGVQRRPDGRSLKSVFI